MNYFNKRFILYKIEKSIEDVVGNHYKYDVSKVQLVNIIKVRFLYFVESSKTFLVENYVENEWRDSYNLYYSRTSYKCDDTVKRVHFITEDIDSYKQITDKNYLGYINLRPIPPVGSVLSRIRLKCLAEAFNMGSANSSFYCLSIDSTVNFPHASIKYKSFPLYAQDSMVAVCAHADILMISKYMYKKFNFNNYSLRDIVQNDTTSFNLLRRIPSESLTIHQMVDLLKINNYNPIAPLFVNGKYADIDIIDYLNSFLESALPVILAFDGHVVIVIGHVHNNEKYYIIADDSTYHLAGCFGTRPSHVELVSEKKLNEIFSKNNVFLITPSFDRFYLHFPYLYLILKETKNLIIKRYFDNNQSIKLITREILVESSCVKQFLCKCGDDTFESVEMPHYIWYVEFYINNKEKENLVFYMLINATAHKLDRTYSIILNNSKQPIITARSSMKNEIKQLSLLTKI